MKDIRLGIVGLGRLGYIHANNILNNIKGAKLVTACSLNNDELKKIKNQNNNIECYENYNKMIDHVDLYKEDDGVISKLDGPVPSET